MNIFWFRYCKNWINFEIWIFWGVIFFLKKKSFWKKKRFVKKVSCLESPKVHLGSNNFEFWWLFSGGKKLGVILGSEFISNQIRCYLVGDGGGGGWRGLKIKVVWNTFWFWNFRNPVKNLKLETFCKWSQPNKATTVQMHRDQLSRSALKRWRVYKPIFSKKCLLNLLPLNFSLKDICFVTFPFWYKLYCFNSEPMCGFMTKEMLLPTVYCNKFAPVERLNYNMSLEQQVQAI